MYIDLLWSISLYLSLCECVGSSDWPWLIRTPADSVTYRVDNMTEVARDLFK